MNESTHESEDEGRRRDGSGLQSPVAGCCRAGKEPNPEQNNAIPHKAWEPSPHTAVKIQRIGSPGTAELLKRGVQQALWPD
jgi:hypothetical protein